jgi:hypothetical protein
VTEALSIASLPEVIREECRRADISAKTTLLEIVRQPDDASMHNILKEITQKKLNREEVRKARRSRREGVGEVKGGAPFVFKYESRAEAYRVEVVFKDGEVVEGQVRNALLAAIDSLTNQAGKER